MRTVSVSDAKARLNELVDEAATTHEQFVITRHGLAAAVLVAADDLESLQETVYWLSQPEIATAVSEARQAAAAGDTVSSDELRAELTRRR